MSILITIQLILVERLRRGFGWSEWNLFGLSIKIRSPGERTPRASSKLQLDTIINLLI